MNIFRRSMLFSYGVAITIFSGALAAQDLGQLKDITGGGSGLSGAVSSLGPLSSVTSGSTGNAAGVIAYCMKNNYLSGGNASSVKDQLVGQMADGGQPAEHNRDYISGAKGIVTGSSGRNMNLSMGGGLEAAAVKKAAQPPTRQHSLKGLQSNNCSSVRRYCEAF